MGRRARSERAGVGRLIGPAARVFPVERFAPASVARVFPVERPVCGMFPVEHGARSSQRPAGAMTEVAAGRPAHAPACPSGTGA